jgi:cell division inhibitor SepF
VGLRKASAWLGLVEDDDGDPSYPEHSGADGYAADAYSEGDEALDPQAPDAPAAARPGMRIASVQAQNFRDAHTIGDYFRQDIPVIINLTDMTAADAKRIVDFASGLVFGRRGDIERLSSRVFLIIPADYEILKEPGALTDEGFFNQA